MTAKRIVTAAGWGVAAAVLLVTGFLNDSVPALALGALAAVLPFCSLAAAAAAKKKLRLKLELPVTAEKNSEIRGALKVRSTARWYPGGVSAAVNVENLLTGERETLPLTAAPLPRRESAADFCLQPPRCGTLRFTAAKAYLCDWTGIFRLALPCGARAKCTVLPETFAVEPVGDPAPVLDPESDRYSPFVRGNDPTEIFDLREYRPGDDVRRLHRKLSEKLDKPVLRTDSLPVDRTLLLYRDARRGAPEEADALAECMVSIAQVLAENDIPFSFARQAAEGCLHMPVRTANDLPGAVLSLLGADDGAAETHTVWELIKRERFGKLLWFSPSAAPETGDAEIPVRVFSIGRGLPANPDNYKTVYQKPEL